MICDRCAKANIPLLIDAEYSSVQPAIDYFTYSATLESNNREQPIVFGTIQTYLRDAKEWMMNTVEAAEEQGVSLSLGVNLGRGAYLTGETRLATSMAAPSPGNTRVMEKVSKGSGALVLATHNVHPGQEAARKTEELGIGKDDEKLQFAQLMGMADGLSMGLKNAGFRAKESFRPPQTTDDF